mgnify:CR=1 FL=1
MFYMNWRLSIIVFFALPIVLIATKIFQKYMKKAFEDVRNEVSNLNSFVQERITGMKIVQIFAREQIESENFSLTSESTFFLNLKKKNPNLKQEDHNGPLLP